MRRSRLLIGLAVMAGSIVWGSVSTLQALPPGAAPTPGMTLSPTSGDSSTEMTLSLAAPNNTCPGDTVTGNYRWNTFMVPASVDVGTLTYNSRGPLPSQFDFPITPLYTAIGGSSIVNRATAVQTGQIVGTSTISFAAFQPNFLPPGQYKIGYACTKVPSLGQAAETQRFWEVPITVTQSDTGGPAQIVWTAGTPTTTTQPATTTTTTVLDTTTTTTTQPTTTTTTTVPPIPPPTPAPVTQIVSATKVGAGGLTIRQRCGAFGAMPSVDDPDLGLLPSVPASVGSPTESTQCGVDLGAARLIGFGPRQGQFYGATGRINQIEVVDSRPGNLPWTVSATFTPFSNGGIGLNDSFSSNLLGWRPQVSTAIDAIGNPDFRVVAGDAVEPSTGSSVGRTLTLATAVPGKTATFVQLDARLKLFIPVAAGNGRYQTTITFTVI